MPTDSSTPPDPPELRRPSDLPDSSGAAGAEGWAARRGGRVLLGTQGWNYADWVGGFYPAGTRPADFLSTYARAFRAVEVDSTFYAVPAAKTVRGWAQRTPPGFTFALKMPQEATHERRLVDAEDVAAQFFDVARELGGKLGPVLLQMGPDFGPDELPALARFLPHVPADVRVAVEVRHAGWNRPGMLDALRALLQEHDAALALSDGRWMPRRTVLDLAARPTTDFHYVRWMGPDRSITRFAQVLVDRADEMDAWAAALQPVLGRAVSLFGFFNNHFSGHSPANARDMQRRLGDLPVDPETLDEQTSLF